MRTPRKRSRLSNIYFPSSPPAQLSKPLLAHNPILYYSILSNHSLPCSSLFSFSSSPQLFLLPLFLLPPLPSPPLPSPPLSSQTFLFPTSLGVARCFFFSGWDSSRGLREEGIIGGDCEYCGGALGVGDAESPGPWQRWRCGGISAYNTLRTTLRRPCIDSVGSPGHAKHAKSILPRYRINISLLGLGLSLALSWHVQDF